MGGELNKEQSGRECIYFRFKPCHPLRKAEHASHTAMEIGSIGDGLVANWINIVFGVRGKGKTHCRQIGRFSTGGAYDTNLD